MQKLIRIWLVCLVLIATAACSTPVAETPGTSQTINEIAPLVSVTGKVVPEEWATVSTQSGGMVVEVLIEEGDEVEEGDVLVRFDNSDAQLAVQQAEAVIAAAKAQVDHIQAGPRPAEVAVAEAQVMAADTIVTQTQTQYNQLWAGGYDAEIAAAEAEIAAAKADQLVARQTHDDTMKCYDVPQPDGSTKKECPTLGTYEERARFVLDAANKRVTAAETQLEAIKKNFNAQVSQSKVAISVAQSQRDVALAQLDLIEAATQPEAIAVAQAAVRQAETTLAVAEVALERTEVHAPFAGTVGLLNVRRGEIVAPGQPLLTLGNLSMLRVETTDLDEIDVARISPGQDAVLTFDAFPDRTFAGTITHIAPMSTPGSGGVNYTVVIELEDMNPALRWGMTAFVDIEVQE